MINDSTKNHILEFFRIMSICHTVIPEKLKHTNKIRYNASSPGKYIFELFVLKNTVRQNNVKNDKK